MKKYSICSVNNNRPKCNHKITAHFYHHSPIRLLCCCWVVQSRSISLPKPISRSFVGFLCSSIVIGMFSIVYICLECGVVDGARCLSAWHLHLRCHVDPHRFDGNTQRSPSGTQSSIVWRSRLSLHYGNLRQYSARKFAAPHKYVPRDDVYIEVRCVVSMRQTNRSLHSASIGCCQSVWERRRVWRNEIPKEISIEWHNLFAKSLWRCVFCSLMPRPKSPTLCRRRNHT